MSPQSNAYPSKRPFNSRRSSQCSVASPISLHERSGYFVPSNGFDDSVDSANGNGFGNLADELAEAFDEDDENGHQLGDEVSETLHDRAEVIRQDQWKENERLTVGNANQKKQTIAISPTRQATSDLSLSPPKYSLRSRHARTNSQYDGSDYGDDSDLEDTQGISSSLEARLAVVESLARRGTEANGSDADDIVQRVADSLKDLGSQAGVENGATRLITAHKALTTHLSHQTRTLSTLTHPLISPLSAPPDSEFVDDLLPLLTALVLAIPTPTSHTLSSLHNLRASTSDLTSLLIYLSDTLHVMRQTTSLASRRLRAARELVIEMRRDTEARETGIHWVEKGNWEGRLADRECARVCGEVVGGFEEVCASWRKRLAGGMAGVEVGAA